MGEAQRDVIQTVQEAVVCVVVEFEWLVEIDGGNENPTIRKVDDELHVGIARHDLHDPLHDCLVEFHCEQPVLVAVVAKDVGEARRDHGAEAVVGQCPHGVFARGTGAEVRTGHEDLGAGVVVLVQHEVGQLAPLREEPLTESRTLDALQPVAGNDLVGVDVGAFQGNGPGCDL